MISMKDIAASCGVSVATVSKAMNDQSDIAEETKRYIKETAKKMGYFPNSAAIALKTNRTYNIGILFMDAAHSGLTHEYFAGVLESFKVEAEKNGYDITFISNHVGERVMTYYEHCRYRSVDGVVIACIDFSDPEVLELVNSEIPVVTIDHIFNNRTAIVSDNVKGMSDLVQYIYDLGHRKIAFIHGEDSSVTRDRLASFYRTVEKLNLEIPEEYVIQCTYHDTEMAARVTRQILNLKERPTCIIYPDDFTSIGGINEIKGMGLRIPEDISVAGYDGISYSQVVEPPLTTIKQDTANLGGKAAKHLIDLIERPKTTLVERVIVEGNVIPGKSVKKISMG